MALNELIEQLRARRLKEVSQHKTRRKDHYTLPPKQVEDEHVGEIEALRTKAEVYRRLLERYAETIGPFEEKTIPELKALVSPEDEAVDRVKAKIFSELREEKGAAWEYSPKEFHSFMEKALAYCKNLKPVNAELSISYWLSPKEMVELGAADAFDKAVFLCSLLISAGGNAKVRVVQLQGGEKRPLVIVSQENAVFVLDPSGEAKPVRANEEEKALGEYSSDGKTIAKSIYEFNNADYADFEE